MDALLDGGFADPVLQSQTAFRAVLDALANPGTLQTLAMPQAAPNGMAAELVSILLTLCDHDTSLWLDPALRADAALVEFLAFHTAAPLTDSAAAATFAAASSANHLPPLDQFNLGTQEYPDRSTTIVLAVQALSGGPVQRLRGPGIKDQIEISPQGLPADFISQWSANRELFPRGIDLLLVADGQVLGLPRSTRIAEGQ